MKALRGLRIETMGGRVPKTGRLYLLYSTFGHTRVRVRDSTEFDPIDLPPNGKSPEADGYQKTSIKICSSLFISLETGASAV